MTALKLGTKPMHEEDHISNAIKALRSAGYAVIIWTPEELDGASPHGVEGRSIELGWQVIEDLK